jgi:hypothetical protein
MNNRSNDLREDIFPATPFLQIGQRMLQIAHPIDGFVARDYQEQKTPCGTAPVGMRGLPRPVQSYAQYPPHMINASSGYIICGQALKPGPVRQEVRVQVRSSEYPHKF